MAYINLTLVVEILLVIIILYLLYDFFTKGKIVTKIGRKKGLFSICGLVIAVVLVGILFVKPKEQNIYTIRKNIERSDLNEYISNYKLSGYKDSTITFRGIDSFIALESSSKYKYMKQIKDIINQSVLKNYSLNEKDKDSKLIKDEKVIVNLSNHKYVYSNDELSENGKKIYGKDEYTDSDSIDNTNNEYTTNSESDSNDEDTSTEKEIKSFKKGSKITTDESEIKIKNIKFTTDVLPDKIEGFYNHYPADKDKVFLEVDTNVKNVQKQSELVEDLGSISLDYNNGYIYNGFLAPEDSQTGFSYANIKYIDPLETLGVKWLVELPKEVTKNKKPIKITLTINGQEYVCNFR